MSIVISDHILNQANMSEAEFRLELALFLYDKRILTMGKASEFAQVSQFAFQTEMKKRGIFISYDEEELEHDLETIMKRKKAE